MSAGPPKKPFFSWREALLESKRAPTTRHVLLTLACHMNEFGNGCFPSTKTLARQTGLSERSVCTHLEVAMKAGWITVQKRRLSGRAWKRHEYQISWPQGTELPSAPSKARKDVQHVKPRGTERRNIKALKDVQSSTSLSTSVKQEEPAKDQQAPAPHPSLSEDAKRQTDTRFQTIADHYFRRFREKVGIRAQFEQADGEALRKILRGQLEATAQDVCRWIDNAFSSTDPFPLRQGFRMTEFARHYGKYVRGPLLKNFAGPGDRPGNSAPTQAELHKLAEEKRREQQVGATAEP